MDLGKEILKSIQVMIDRKLDNYRADHTYKTVIKRIDKKGYVILDDTGCERTVKCAIPNVQLRTGQMVWVTLPQGKLNEIYISGISGK